MLNNITFGQFYPAASFVHRMDPRVKILLVIVYIATVFVVKNFWGFLAAGCFLLFVISLSRIPILSVLKSIKAIIYIVVITFIINLFFHGGSAEKWQLHIVWGIYIKDVNLEFALFMSLRLIMLVMGSSILTLTTPPVALADGLESLMSPLRVVKFPAHEIALIISIALRFIPTLMEETQRIISAQKARGADFESGNLIKKAKALLPVLIPLLVSAFRRADELGDAMDARCYNSGKKRTKFKVMKLGLRDLFGSLVTLGLLAGIICINIFVTVAVI